MNVNGAGKLLLAVLSVLAVLGAVNVAAQTDERIPRGFLVNMAKNQFDVLCNSEAFASCMGFTSKECLILADEAVKQCLLPLPEMIHPDELDNSAIESCPQTIFADAGYSDDKAGMCFDQVVRP